MIFTLFWPIIPFILEVILFGFWGASAMYPWTRMNRVIYPVHLFIIYLFGYLFGLVSMVSLRDLHPLLQPGPRPQPSPSTRDSGTCELDRVKVKLRWNIFNKYCFPFWIGLTYCCETLTWACSFLASSGSSQYEMFNKTMANVTDNSTGVTVTKVQEVISNIIAKIPCEQIKAVSLLCPLLLCCIT